MKERERANSSSWAGHVVSPYLKRSRRGPLGKPLTLRADKYQYRVSLLVLLRSSLGFICETQVLTASTQVQVSEWTGVSVCEMYAQGKGKGSLMLPQPCKPSMANRLCALWSENNCLLYLLCPLQEPVSCKGELEREPGHGSYEQETRKLCRP